jgi:pimeloyl-ACP methyl ester carboxylesterase
MKRSRWLAGILGLMLVVLSVCQIRAAAAGLSEVRASSGAVPIVFIGPAQGMDGSRPLVLVGHGFAGSGTVMRAFAYAFAHAGYVVALWDFAGHGANPSPLPANAMDGSLVPTAEAVLTEAKRLGLADSRRLAILGHSMGSGVALSFGQQHPETAVTIAVSPVATSVTPELPHNLLLMAGSLEPSFVASAEKRLAEAGGAGGDPAKGTGRKMAVVQGVEHLSILFAPQAHATALQWLDATFGAQPGAAPYTDQRILWFGIGVLGALLVSATLIPRAPAVAPDGSGGRQLWRRGLAVAGGALAATLMLWAANLLGVRLSGLLGLSAGGYLIFWFALAGIAGLILLGGRLSVPTRRELLAGVLIFAGLWLGVGLLGDMVWLPWLLIRERLVLWPLAIFGLLPWCLLIGEAGRPAGAWGRMGWWLVQSMVLFAALTLAIRLSSELGFLTLILPVFPIVLLFQTLPNIPQKGAWTSALSGALFVSWMLLAVFPLQ